MRRSNVTKTITQLYGTGHFNPRSFDRRPSNKRLYLWAISLFLLAVALATALGIYLFAGTPDSFTGERVVLALAGPVNVRAGGDETFQLRITNNEEVDLEGAELFIGYTASERSSVGPTFQIIKADNQDVVAAKNTWSLGSIKQSETLDFPLTLRFNGQVGQRLLVAFYLNVRPKGFSSDYSVKLEQEFSLGQLVLNFAIAGPTAVGRGSEATFTIIIEKGEQNAFDKMEDWQLALAYPASFQDVTTEPEKPAEGWSASGRKDDFWRVGDLPLEDDAYRLAVKGKVEGSLGDKLKFSAELKNPQDASRALKAEKEIVIQTTAAQVTVAMQPASGKKLQWGEAANFNVLANNTGSETLTNLTVSVNLMGEDFWRSDSLKIGASGFFEGSSIIWDAKTTPALASLGPGEIKTLTFSLTTRAEPNPNLSSQPAITAKAKLSAKLGDEEVIVESEELAAKVLANIEFDVAGAYSNGNNPPLPGQETTYAVLLKIGPTSSELKDVLVSASLPKNVVWKSDTEYSTGELRYSADSRKVVWRASKLPKLAEPLLIRFLVGVTPADEVTNNLVIIPQTALVATDGLAGETLELYSTAVRLGDIK